jgi:hypothetical protein
MAADFNHIAMPIFRVEIQARAKKDNSPLNLNAYAKPTLLNMIKYGLTKKQTEGVQDGS